MEFSALKPEYMFTLFKLQMQDIAGIHLNIDINKYLHVLHLDKLNSLAGKF